MSLLVYGILKRNSGLMIFTIHANLKDNYGNHIFGVEFLCLYEMVKSEGNI